MLSVAGIFDLAIRSSLCSAICLISLTLATLFRVAACAQPFCKYSGKFAKTHHFGHAANIIRDKRSIFGTTTFDDL